MSDTKSMKTQMHTSKVLVKDENSKKVDQTIERGMIGFLLYLTVNRSNIMIVFIYEQDFSQNPKSLT